MAYLTYFRDVLSSLQTLNNIHTTSKSFIDVGLHFVMNTSNNQIKQHAIEYLTELYRHIGKALRNALVGKKAYLNVQVVHKLEKAFDVVDKGTKRINKSKLKYDNSNTNTSIEEDEVDDDTDELGFHYTTHKYPVKKNASERSYRNKSKDNEFKVTVTPIKKKSHVNNYQQQFITEQNTLQQRKRTITPDNTNTRKQQHHLVINNNNINCVVDNEHIPSIDIDHIYIHYNNYYELKKTRNITDVQSKTNFFSIKNHFVYDNISLFYLSSFLSETFILNKLSKFTSFVYEIRFFIKLIQDNPNKHTATPNSNSFRLYFYPNYDLVLKYLITKTTSLPEHEPTLYEHLYNFFHTFYKQLKLNDLLLDIVEIDLTLQTLIEMLKQLKREMLFTPVYNLIKLFINLSYVHMPYELLIKYALWRNSVFIMQVVLEMFKENLQSGQIDTNAYNVASYMKSFAKVASCSNVKVQRTLKHIFNVFKSTLHSGELRSIINDNLTTQEQNTINSIMSTCNDSELFVSEVQFDDDDNNNSDSNSYTPLTYTNVNVSYNNNNENDNCNDNTTTTTTRCCGRDNNNNNVMQLLQLINQSNDVISKQQHVNALLNMLSASNVYTKHKRSIKSAVSLFIQTVINETETFFYVNPPYVHDVLRLVHVFTSNPKLLHLLYQSNVYDLVLLFIKYMKHNDTTLSRNGEMNYEKVSELLVDVIENSELTQAILLFMDIAVKEKDNCDYGIQGVNCLMKLANQIKAHAKTSDVNIKDILTKVIAITSRIKKSNYKEHEHVIKGLKYVVFELVDLRKHAIYKDYEEVVHQLHKEDNNVKRWISNYLSETV